MAKLVNFIFNSKSIIDDEYDSITFNAKGYEINDRVRTLYFSYDNVKYKYIIDENNNISVYVNESVYCFNSNKKTEAIINSGGYSIKVSVITNKINIDNDYIEIDYILDFETFKGKYNITLKLY